MFSNRQKQEREQGQDANFSKQPSYKDKIVSKIKTLEKSNGKGVPSVKNIYKILTVDHQNLFVDSSGKLDTELIREKSFEIFDKFLDKLEKDKVNVEKLEVKKLNDTFNKFFNDNKRSLLYESEATNSCYGSLAPIMMTDIQRTQYGLLGVCPNPSQIVESACMELALGDEGFLEVTNGIDSRWPKYETICKMLSSYITYKGASFKDEKDGFVSELCKCNGDEEKVYEFLSSKIDELWGSHKEVLSSSLKSKFDKAFNVKLADYNFKEYLSQTFVPYYSEMRISSAPIRIIRAQEFGGSLYGQKNTVENNLLVDLGISLKNENVSFSDPNNKTSAISSVDDIQKAFFTCFTLDSEKMLMRPKAYNDIYKGCLEYQRTITEKLRWFFDNNERYKPTTSDVQDDAKAILSSLKSIKCFKHLIKGIIEIDELSKKIQPPIKITGMINWLGNVKEVLEKYRTTQIESTGLFDTIKGFVAEVEHVKHLINSDEGQDIREISIGLRYGSNAKVKFSQDGELDCLITYKDGRKVGVEVKSSENAYNNAHNIQKHEEFCSEYNIDPRVVVFVTEGGNIKPKNGTSELVTIEKPKILEQLDSYRL